MSYVNHLCLLLFLLGISSNALLAFPPSKPRTRRIAETPLNVAPGRGLALHLGMQVPFNHLVSNN